MNKYNKMCFLISLITLLSVSSFPVFASHYPVTIKSCDREVVFHQAPQRAVSNDINITEMMVALDLQSNMAGYSSVTNYKHASPKLMKKLGTVPEISPRYPNIEVLLDVNADFYFAGWSYGMRVGGDITPATLAPLGIQVYELTESCSRIMQTNTASMADVFQDLSNLGKIFNVEQRAVTLIAQLTERLDHVKQKIGVVEQSPRVFLFDTGGDRPLTSGRLGMPQALFDLVGAKNIAEDVNGSWTRINWETVVERDPQVIVIVDYGSQTAEEKINVLLTHPALKNVSAIVNQRFIVLPYGHVTPSVSNVDAVEILAKGLYPQRFIEESR